MSGGDARSNRRDDFSRLRELRVTIRNAMAPRDPAEVGVNRPYLALLVFLHQQPYRPVEAGLAVTQAAPSDAAVKRGERNRATIAWLW